MPTQEEYEAAGRLTNPNTGGDCPAATWSVRVSRTHRLWIIEKGEQVDVSRHTLQTATERPLTEDEQIINTLCEFISQNVQAMASADKQPTNSDNGK